MFKTCLDYAATLAEELVTPIEVAAREKHSLNNSTLSPAVSKPQTPQPTAS